MFALLTRGWLFWIWSIRLNMKAIITKIAQKMAPRFLKKCLLVCFFLIFSFQTFLIFALRFIGRAAMLTHRTRWTGKIWAVIWSQRMTWTSFSIRFLKIIKYFYHLISIPNQDNNSYQLETLFISGLKSRVLKLSFLSLKMTVRSGLEFILKLTKPLQSCCCPVQKYLPRMTELVWQPSRYLCRTRWISK